MNARRARFPPKYAQATIAYVSWVVKPLRGVPVDGVQPRAHLIPRSLAWIDRRD